MQKYTGNSGRRNVLKLGAAALAFGSLNLRAQGVEKKPIKVVVAFPPGASNDLIGRLLATEFSKAYAPGSLVDNRPGAGGVLAAQLVMKSPADGTTLLIVSFPFPLINSMYAKSKIDVTHDFVPVASICGTPNVIAVSAASPFKTLQELLAHAKANPKKLSFASTGYGTSPHLGMELVMQKTGTQVTHVPYKGSAPATTDLLGGQVDFTLDNLLNVLPYARAGKMRPLAVTSGRRSPVMPDVPTLGEAGVPGVVMDIWIAVVAPAGTPRDTLQSLNSEVHRILDLPETKKRFEDLGIEPIKDSPADLGRVIAADVVKWGNVVRESKISVE